MSQLRAVSPVWHTQTLLCVSVLPSESSTPCSCPGPGVRCREFHCAGSELLGSCCTKNLSASPPCSALAEHCPLLGMGKEQAELLSALHLLRGLSLNSLKCLPLMEAPVEALRGMGSGGGEGVGDALTWTRVHPWLSLLQLQGWAPLLEGMPWFRALRASAFHLPRGWQPNNVFQECSVHSLNVWEP